MSGSPRNSPQLLKEHFDDPYHRGDCEIATHASQSSQPQSNCEIRFEFAVDDRKRILEAWWDGQGCEHCEGFASLLCEALEGGCVEEVLRECQSAANLRTEEPAAGTGSLSSTGLPKAETSSAPSTGMHSQSSIDQVVHSVRQFEGLTDCTKMVWEIVLLGLQSPLSALDDDLAEGQQFGGPSLREEC